MAEADSEQLAEMQDLAGLRGLTREASNQLRAQDRALRERGMKLPTGVTQSLSEVIEDVFTLEENTQPDLVELGQLRALTATGAMINSTLDLDDVLARAMDTVIELVGAERGFIILKDASSEQMEFRVARDSAGKAESTDSTQISMTIVQEVIRAGKALLTDNAYKDPRMQDHMSVAQFVLRSVICVPLAQKNRLLGVVYVDNRLRAGVFTERELNLLTAFANQIAVAIENARLFTRIQKTLEEITEMKDVIDNVFGSIGSGIITTNADNLVITLNRAAEQILSISAEGAVGKPLWDVLPRVEEISIADQLKAALQENRITSVQSPVILDGRADEAVLSFKFSPLRDRHDQVQGVTMVVDDLTEQTQREAMLDVLQNYLPPGMMSRIHEIAGIDLGGERRDVTCMFVETRPFGSFPPGTQPEELMTMVNRYLSVATEAIHAQEGVIDKYMGSEVMVLFNSQLNPQEDHAVRALRAALTIRTAFVNFYAENNIEADPHWYRIGIHSGIATLGNVGSLYRRNFTAIGDTINLSKRLQENAKAGQIIVSEALLEKAHTQADALPNVSFEERAAIQVKGRRQSTRIYEIFGAN